MFFLMQNGVAVSISNTTARELRNNPAGYSHKFVGEKVIFRKKA
jgi:hypothetical protein